MEVHVTSHPNGDSYPRFYYNFKILCPNMTFYGIAIFCCILYAFYFLPIYEINSLFLPDFLLNGKMIAFSDLPFHDQEGRFFLLKFNGIDKQYILVFFCRYAQFLGEAVAGEKGVKRLRGPVE